MLNRFNGNVVPFAIDATATNRTVFGDTLQSDDIDDNLNTDFKKGWEIVGINDNPTKQDFNGLAYTLGNLVSYLYQQGIAEYNATQKYLTNSYIVASDGEIYQSLTGDATTPNVGNDPLTDTINWKKLLQAQKLLDLIKTVDGSGSGLDADTVDGKNTQQSLVDTSDTLMRVGAFGLGVSNNSNSTTETDLDDLKIEGTWNCTDTITNAPAGIADSYFLVKVYIRSVLSTSAMRIIQEAYVDANKKYIRYQDKDGVWSSWQEIIYRSSDFVGDDYTLLADYPSRKYDGTITLSESIQNFKYMVIVSSDNVEDTMKQERTITVSELNTNGDYLFFIFHDEYARWVYTNETTFDFLAETGSWIRKIYGVGRL